MEKVIDRNEFLRKAVVHICGSLDIEVALKSFLDYLKNFMPLDELELSVRKPEMNIIEVVTIASKDGNPQYAKIRPAPRPPTDPTAEESYGLEYVKVVNKPERVDFLREFHNKTGLDLNFSMMILVLVVDGQEIGGLLIKAWGKNSYTKEHAQLVDLLRAPFAIALANALKHQEVQRLKNILDDDNQYFQQQLREMTGSQIIGADFGLKRVMSLIDKVAPLNSPVLLLGETGVGKEVLANAVHRSSPRRDGPFIKVNCGAIPETLLDSELFGHEKGAFTGATKQKRGRFERGCNGTVFLDEVGELPLQAQVRLLHVLQSRQIERVGGTEPIDVDIRIISATNRNLQEMVDQGGFREDLWFRLNVFPIMIPPLRRRKEDIPALVHYFLERKALDMKLKDKPRLAKGSMAMLLAYDWPGNVRELENMVERALIQHKGGEIFFDRFLNSNGKAQESALVSLEEKDEFLSLKDVDIRHISLALKKAKGKISGPNGAAQLLDLHPNTLRKKMNKLKIPFGRNVDYS